MSDRKQEKQASRDHDEDLLLAGLRTAAQLQAENGFFSVLDRSKARLVARRVKVNIKGVGHE